MLIIKRKPFCICNKAHDFLKLITFLRKLLFNIRQKKEYWKIKLDGNVSKTFVKKMNIYPVKSRIYLHLGMPFSCTFSFIFSGENSRV